MSRVTAGAVVCTTQNSITAGSMAAVYTAKTTLQEQCGGWTALA